MNSEERQKVVDAEHLDLLGLFHYVVGGLGIAMSTMFVFQYVLLRMILGIPEIQAEMAQDAPAVQAVLDFVVAFFGIVVAVAVIYGVLLVISGWFLRARRHRMFSFLVAIPILVMIPWGTILGVLTMVVLERASVQALYRERQMQ